MINITQEQARSRYIIIPGVLQDAIFSDQTTDIIASTIEKFSLSDEKSEKIPVLVGWVLLGFLHPEDLASEISATEGVPKEVAKEMADSFTTKIFAPLKPVLDKSYKPVPEPQELPSLGPKIIDNAKSFGTAVPKPIAPSATIPQPAKLPSLSEKGWSGQRGVADIRPAKPVGEFERLMKSSASAPPQQQQRPTIIQSTSVPQPIKNAPQFHSAAGIEDIMKNRGVSSVPMPTRPAILEVGGILPKTSSTNQTTGHVIHYSDLKSPLPAPLSTLKVPVAEPGRSITEINGMGAPTATLPTTQTTQPPSLISVTASLPPKLMDKISPANMPATPPMPPKPPVISTMTNAAPRVQSSSPVSSPRPMTAPASMPSMPPKTTGEKVIVKDFT